MFANFPTHFFFSFSISGFSMCYMTCDVRACDCGQCMCLVLIVWELAALCFLFVLDLITDDIWGLEWTGCCASVWPRAALSALRFNDHLLSVVLRSRLVNKGDRALAVVAPELWNQLLFFILDLLQHLVFLFLSYFKTHLYTLDFIQQECWHFYIIFIFFFSCLILLAVILWFVMGSGIWCVCTQNNNLLVLNVLYE